MEVKELICIGCPMGCNLKVEMIGEEVNTVTGNTCKRGNDYARKEVTNPTRIVTSTVMTETSGVVSVKTKNDIPKEKIMDVIKELKQVRVKLPIKIGDIVVKNAAGTGIDVIATKSM